MIKFFFWAVLFMATLALETSFFPKFLGAWLPTFSFIVLLLGFAYQGFWEGLLFAGITGIVRDSLAPSGSVRHTVFFILIFVATVLFRELSGWDEPARRIGVVAFAIVTLPFMWIASARLSELFFRAYPSGSSFSDIFSWPAYIELAFSTIWFFAFVWISVRWSRKQNTKALSRLT